MSIDKTDGCQVYLSKASLNTEIVTAKSSEMNICVPSSTTDGDFVSCGSVWGFKYILLVSVCEFVCMDTSQSVVLCCLLVIPFMDL